ncbi:uncharacterized protein N7484_008269 [Penicillium longicatenatum]|uniref:uncharacterized protein n=1 Tax=Penicillium longicatenatum TaxID=1561947 RepID=UPI002546C73F|nr:uncharacterized protein N7484_008269 [Penicillium longicatenatum]KAJ5634956.1 hypothetical protein N7484_008269 [Penicillium longicatenatum]
MATAGTGWSRALRSRLLQQRLPHGNASQQFELRTASKILRSYTTATAGQDEPHVSADQETSLAPLSVSRSSAPENAFGRNSRRPKVSSGESEARKREDLLMEIAQQSSSQVNRKHVRLEMEWVQDPLLLAQRVSTALRGGDPAMAVALAREATKQIPGTKFVVAWNRIFGYCFDKGHPKPALRFFNDMKKRAGKPNPQTFTILLMGLRKSSKVPGFNVVRTAEAIYNSISAENSEVERDIIHTNAMLSVCQYHGDMDTLWRIAGGLPEQGPGAPDMSTYTAILGTLLFAHRNKIKTMDASQIDHIFALKAQLINDGKRIWADILYRWQNDGLPPDAHVVQSMAALLLEGASDHDYYDVFALYHQTMAIPIFSTRPPESAKNTPTSTWRLKQTKLSEPPVEEDVPFVDENNRTLKINKDGQEEEKPSIEKEEEDFDSLFDPLPTGPVPGLQPGNKDLTIIQEACLNITQGSKSGYEYWKHLTSTSTSPPIEPDEVAAIQFLRLLRVSRASNKAVELVRGQLIQSGQVSGKIFHIALSVCRRDKHNHSCLLHANKIMDMMGESLVLPDLRALQGYLELVQALSQQPGILMYLRGLGIEEGREARTLRTMGKKLQAKLHLFALATLRPHFAQLHEAIERGKPLSKSRWDSVRNGNGVPGALAVKIMARIRLMIDEVLKSEYSTFVSKAERGVLESESITLKKYSDQNVIMKLSAETVFATPKQRSVHRERKTIPAVSDTCELDEQKTEKTLESSSSRPAESEP